MSDSNTGIALTKKQSSKITRALDALESVRAEVETESGSSISWYLDGTTNLCLMEGGSHDKYENANRDMVIDAFTFTKAGGGDW